MHYSPAAKTSPAAKRGTPHALCSPSPPAHHDDCSEEDSASNERLLTAVGAEDLVQGPTTNDRSYTHPPHTATLKRRFSSSTLDEEQPHQRSPLSRPSPFSPAYSSDTSAPPPLYFPSILLKRRSTIPTALYPGTYDIYRLLKEERPDLPDAELKELSCLEYIERLENDILPIPSEGLEHVYTS